MVLALLVLSPTHCTACLMKIRNGLHAWGRRSRARCLHAHMGAPPLRAASAEETRWAKFLVEWSKLTEGLDIKYTNKTPACLTYTSCYPDWTSRHTRWCLTWFTHMLHKVDWRRNSLSCSENSSKYFTCHGIEKRNCVLDWFRQMPRSFISHLLVLVSYSF